MQGFDEYQQEAARTGGGDLREGNTSKGLSCAGLGLVGESGEVADIIKKVVHHHRDLDTELEAKLKKEAGDVLWLADVTARAVAAEEALATIAKALRIPTNRDPAEIAQRALASIKTYALDAKVQGAEIERLQNALVELHEENKKLHARAKRGTRGTGKTAPRVAVETPVEFLHRYIRERAAGVGR